MNQFDQFQCVFSFQMNKSAVIGDIFIIIIYIKAHFNKMSNRNGTSNTLKFKSNQIHSQLTILNPISFSRKQLNLSNSKDYINEEKQIASTQNLIKYNREVPIFTVTKVQKTLTLNQKIGVYAKGKLYGNSLHFNQEIQFYGVFQGIFTKTKNQFQETYFYFQGKITKIKFLRPKKIKGLIKDNNNFNPNKQFKMKGFFQGMFMKDYMIIEQINSVNESQQYDYPFTNETDLKIVSQLSHNKKVFIPVMTRFFIEQISQINMAQSFAEVNGILYIDIILNEETVDLLNKKWSLHEEKVKYRLALDFNRDRLIQLPFYDTQDTQFNKTQDEEQYEWDDNLAGIILQAKWNQQQKRMSYSIQTSYRAEIDNSHGNFFSPFNLNILKIIISFHSITITDQITVGSQTIIAKTKLQFVCCDMQDYGTKQNSIYTPFVGFNQLQFSKHYQLSYDQKQSELSQAEKILKQCPKHIDRLTKINKADFESFGQFKVATNRLNMFPYHRRTMANSYSKGQNFSWMCGIQKKDNYFTAPEVQNIKQRVKTAKQNKDYNFNQFKIHSQWQYIHIYIPLYKYPGADIFRIFIPILILNVISLLIFEQENGTSGGITKISSRIASACSLLIAYTAMIPTLRSNLPPTPSITMLQFLIYLSILPNYLAIFSCFVMWTIDYAQFFNTYKAFIDPLFLISFIISCFCFLVNIVFLLVYTNKKFDKKYTFPNFKPNPKFSHLRQPIFLKYMDQVQQIRTQFDVKQSQICIKAEQSYEQQRIQRKIFPQIINKEWAYESQQNSNHFDKLFNSTSQNFVYK